MDKNDRGLTEIKYLYVMYIIKIIFFLSFVNLKFEKMLISVKFDVKIRTKDLQICTKNEICQIVKSLNSRSYLHVTKLSLYISFD